MSTKSVNMVNKSKKGVSQGVRRQIAVGALSAVMPVERACELVGYSPNTRPAKNSIAAETTDQIRKTLQSTPGFTLYDSVDFCRKVRDEDKKAALDQKLSANRDIVKIMGYGAPDKIEVQQTHSIIAAVGVIHNMLGSGIDPVQLQSALKSRQETPQIDQKYTAPVYANQDNTRNSLIYNGTTTDDESIGVQNDSVSGSSESAAQPENEEPKKNEAGGGAPL